MLKKQSQRGFTLVEGLLLLVVIVIISGLGFYIYSINKGHQSSSNDSTPQAKSKDQSVPENKYKDWTNHQLVLANTDIKYPKSWTVTAKPELQTNESATVVLSAPETKVETYVSGASSVVNGAEISIYADRASKAKSIEEFNTSSYTANRYSVNKKEQTINGIQMLSFDVAYEAPDMHYTLFYKDSTQYMIVMQKDIYAKPEYATIYNNLVNSIGTK